MAILNVCRIIVQLLGLAVTLASIGFVIAALFSSGWQIMPIHGTGEIHQHGLWFDYVYAQPHLADPGAGTFQWIFSYKLGSAVYGDEAHRAKSYQLNALVLLCIAGLSAAIGVLLSCYAGMKIFLGITWAVSLLLGTILGGAALGQFYVNAMLPQNRFEYTDRKVMEVVGYAFYQAMVGVIGFAIAMVCAIVVAVLVFMMQRTKKTETVKYTVWTQPPAATSPGSFSAPKSSATAENVKYVWTRSPVSSIPDKQMSPSVLSADQGYVEYATEPHRIHSSGDSASSQHGDTLSEFSHRPRRLSQEVAAATVMPLVSNGRVMIEKSRSPGHQSPV